MKRNKVLFYSILLLSFFISNSNYAQNYNSEDQSELDRLNAIIDNPSSKDTSIIKAYVDLSDILYVSNLDTVKYLCEKAKTIAEEGLKNNPDFKTKKSLLNTLGNAFNNLGFYYGKIGDVEKQKEFYIQSLKIQEEIENKEGIADCLNNLGRFYERQGDISEALNNFYKSLNLSKQIDSKQGIAIALNNLAGLFENQGDYEKALDYHFESLKIREEYMDKGDVAVGLNNIGYN